MDRKQIAIDFAKSLNHSEIEKIILFGSVARGDDNKDSDIDILIITSKKSDKRKIKGDVYSKTFDILMKNGEYISAKIKSLNHYNKYKNFSFFSNVDREGILLN
ncbi:nucleotidyltransferase domain-containing protein [Methanobrevibacter filiformis]|uniref:protein adenylyltransferase n=1 Tax=Methanobrevibacter filiformis TaxID=55758 RepID=A0A166A2I2_9EURY|nr:nucleotidyltransferase domain-containing protein [Methanobrevibacter filiformis]KZX11481.1 nucleotidyltransferase domain protein [Methanobrevibacter filiformis]